jgi:CxxC motif-containing protein
MSILKEVICLECPLACNISVELDDNGNIISINNNKCPRGVSYARQEILKPTRVLTSTVYIDSIDKEHPLLPVMTDGSIPKNLLQKAMKELAKIRVDPPVKYEDVIIENLLDTGVNVISTFEVLK